MSSEQPTSKPSSKPKTRKRQPVEYEYVMTEELVDRCDYVSGHVISKPEGAGWRVVSHSTSVSDWAHGNYGSVLVTYVWEREVNS